MGEHAVLQHKLALVCAVNQRVHVKLSILPNRDIIIDSSLGHLATTIDSLEIAKPFQFITACLVSLKSQLPSGCHIEIQSEFSEQIGFGSSAAVTVATLSVLRQCLGLSLEPTELVLHARKVVREVQGMGSGADVAASVLGGTIAYRSEPLMLKKLTNNPPLCAVYSGSKLPTKHVIEIVESKRKLEPKNFDEYFNQIEHQVVSAIMAINAQDWTQLAVCLRANQAIMTQLGVNNAILQHIIEGLEQQSGILAAKISGSGLGDCVIGLGSMEPQIFPRTDYEVKCGIKQIAIEISTQGVSHGSN